MKRALIRELSGRFTDWQKGLIVDKRRYDDTKEAGRKAIARIQRRQAALIGAVVEGPESLGEYLREKLEVAADQSRYWLPMPRPLSPDEYRNPPIELEAELGDSWEPELAGRAALASSPLFWLLCHVDWIEDGRLGVDGHALKEAFLLTGSADGLKSAAEMDKAARNFLRRTGGLPVIRGNTSVFSDCPLSRAWWRRQLSKEASETARGLIRRSEAHALLHRHRPCWEEMVMLSLKRVTAINQRNARAALMIHLGKLKAANGDFTKHDVKAAAVKLARASLRQALDAMPMDAVLSALEGGDHSVERSRVSDTAQRIAAQALGETQGGGDRIAAAGGAWREGRARRVAEPGARYGALSNGATQKRSGLLSDCRRLADEPYKKFRTQMLRRAGGGLQREFLEIVQEGDLFASYLLSIGTSGTEKVELWDEPLSDGEYVDPSSHTEQGLYSRWAPVSEDVARSSSFWAYHTLRHIRAGRIQAFALAGSREGGGEERILAALRATGQAGAAQMDSCVRAVLGRLGGLVEARGKPSVYVDCPFARAWWREHFAAEASGGDPEIRNGVRALARISQSYWEQLVERFLQMTSPFALESARDSLLRVLAHRVFKERNPRLANPAELRRVSLDVAARWNPRAAAGATGARLDAIIDSAIRKAEGRLAAPRDQ